MKIEGEVIIKKNILLSVIIVNFVFIIIFSLFSSVFSQTISVDDYIKGKFPSIFNFYLSSLEDLDSYEKEFIDLLQKLPKDKQEYYAKEVYKNGFYLELLKSIKEGKTIKEPTSSLVLPSLPKEKEKPIESWPSIIKRIEPSTVIVFTYDNKGNFLRLGSGFFISQNGDIVTNYHILQGASSAEVKTSGGKTYPITCIVAEDEQYDLIRLSVDIPSQYVHSLSLSISLPEVGERIIVYGSPLGLEKTVSDGIVSAIREVPSYGKVIQITAPVSPGSSGSPVINTRGEVIGIATFQMVEGQNLNFAISSEKIAKLNEKATSYYFDKGLDYMIEEEYEKALYFLEIMIKIGPLDTLAYWMIGYCNEELGVYTKAIEAYKQAISIDPDDYGAYYGLGRSYDALRLYKDAIEAYKQAISIDPDIVHVHYSLGLCYSIIGDKSSALNEYKILKELDIDKANELFDLIY